jgi:hypothetical protein
LSFFTTSVGSGYSQKSQAVSDPPTAAGQQVIPGFRTAS